MYELITNTQLWLAILGSNLLVQIFNKIFDHYTGKKKTDQILLLDAIERLSDKVVVQKYRTHNQTQRLQEAYAQYKKIGGDGYADALLADAMKEPIKE